MPVLRPSLPASRLLRARAARGFTLVEISDMIAHHEDGEAAVLSMSPETVRDQIAHLERQRLEIDEALAELRKSYETLSRHGAR